MSLSDSGTSVVASRVRPGPLVVAAALVEVLAGAGVLPVWAGLSHEVALPPLDLVSDLGVLLARATSVPWFALGLAASLVGRAALLSLVLGWSRRRFERSLRFYLAALPPAYVGAALVASAQVGLYSLLFWAGLLVIAVTVAVLAPLPWRSDSMPGGLLSALRHGARLPTVGVYLVALAAIGGAARRGGYGAELAGVAASAALTWWLATRLLRAGPRPARIRIGALAIALAALLVVELVPAGTATGPQRTTGRAGSLFLVPGIDTSSGHGTMFRLVPRSLGFSCATTYYFSYTGLGSGAPRGESACPIRAGAAYSRADTERPLSQLETTFDAQLAGLPRPVTVITHSSGSWVAWAALSAAHRRSSPPTDLVLLGPLADPLGYPPPGRAGPGVVAAAGARLVSAGARRANFSEFRLDAPLAVELLGQPARLRSLLARPLPSGIRAGGVLAGFDLPLFVGATDPFPGVVKACVPEAGHSGLVTSPDTAGLVNRFLAGTSLPGCRPGDTWQGALAAGFRLPDPTG